MSGSHHNWLRAAWALLWLLLPQLSVVAQSSNDPFAQYQPSVAARVINGGGQLLLALTNNSANEMQMVAVIGLGEPAPQELGQVALRLPPHTESIFRFKQVLLDSKQYSLRLLTSQGRLLLFQLGPLQFGGLSPQAIDVALEPLGANRTKPTSLNQAALAGSSVAAPSMPASAPPAVPAEVTVTARLLAGPRETDPPTLALELSALRPVSDARLRVTFGKFKESKPVSINRVFVTEFRLPAEMEALEGEAVRYELTAKNGRVIAQGEISLEQLLSADSINATDLAYDKHAYELGETVKLTLALEGRSAHGYRVEALAKDSAGAVFFREQREGKADAPTFTQEFTVTLPRTGERPFMFEFKIFDGETGALFDSGEREFPVRSGNE